MATFQDSNCDVYALAKTSSDAQIMLEALETGTDGVLLKTEDPKEVSNRTPYQFYSVFSNVGELSTHDLLGGR